MMLGGIQHLFLLFLLINICSGRLGVTQLTLTDTTATSVNYTSNIGSCTCDLRTNYCDLFCCCDPSCTSSELTPWISNQICDQSSFTSKINYCNDSNFSLASVQRFESINCIYFDNSNTIGKYYPSWGGSLISTDKMYKIEQNRGQVYGQIQTSSKYLVKSSVYIPKSTIKNFGTKSDMEIPVGVGGGSCFNRPLLIGESLSYTCYRKIVNCNTANPQSLNSICSDGTCSSSASKTGVNISNTGCSEIVNSIDISFSLQGKGNYTIKNYSLAHTNISTTVGSIVPLSVTVKFIMIGGTVKGGAPGYVNGQTVILLEGDAYQLYTPKAGVTSIGSCQTSSNNQMLLNFNTPSSFMCKPTDCNIGSIGSIIPSSKLYIPRYGDINVQKKIENLVEVKFSSRSSNCSIPLKASLNFIYSYSGTDTNPQYYIVSALVSYTQYNQDPITTSATFQVRWKYINPSEIAQPINNAFYSYFEKLWVPLRNALFGSFLNFTYLIMIYFALI